MPFQALPIALRANTGDALSKLVWIWMVQKAQIHDAPNGLAYVGFETRELCLFSQSTEDEVVAAIERLERLCLVERIYYKGWGEAGTGRDEAFADIVLPISELRSGERRRIKGSPDQLNHLLAKQGYICVTCGIEDHDASNWHLDHIIPRSLGGADVELNCQVICPTCNARKGAKLHFVDFLGGRHR
jgi:hypothetical protein